MMDNLIGRILIKNESYYQSDSGRNEDTFVCGFGDSNNGLIEQDIRKYVYTHEERKLIEYTKIISEKPTNNVQK